MVIYISDKDSGRFYVKGTKNPFTHCIVYRHGNRENFKWHRSFPNIKEECLDIVNSMNKEFYNLAYCVNYKQSLNIGLPETYD